MSETFQSRFAAVLLERGLTQAQLAAQLQVTQATVSRWIKGTFQPNIQTRVALARFLGVRTEWLAKGEGQKEDAGIYENLTTPYALSPRTTWRDKAKALAGAGTFAQSEEMGQMRDYMRLYLRDLNDPQIIAKIHETLDYSRLEIRERVILVQDLLDELAERYTSPHADK